MTAVRKVLQALVNFGGLLAGLVMAALFVLTLAEIVNRAVLGQSFTIAVEYAGYLVALSFFIGSGWAFKQAGHIRINLVRDFLPGRLSRTLDLLATAMALIVTGLIAFALIEWSWGTYQRGDVSFFPSATPLWLPQAAFSLGPVLLACAVLDRLLGLLTGDGATGERP